MERFDDGCRSADGAVCHVTRTLSMSALKVFEESVQTYHLLSDCGRSCWYLSSTFNSLLSFYVELWTKNMELIYIYVLLDRVYLMFWFSWMDWSELVCGWRGETLWMRWCSPAGLLEPGFWALKVRWVSVERNCTETSRLKPLWHFWSFSGVSLTWEESFSWMSDRSSSPTPAVSSSLVELFPEVF